MARMRGRKDGNSGSTGGETAVTPSPAPLLAAALSSRVPGIRGAAVGLYGRVAVSTSKHDAVRHGRTYLVCSLIAIGGPVSHHEDGRRGAMPAIILGRGRRRRVLGSFIAAPGGEGRGPMRGRPMRNLLASLEDVRAMLFVAGSLPGSPTLNVAVTVGQGNTEEFGKSPAVGLPDRVGLLSCQAILREIMRLEGREVCRPAPRL